MLSLISETKTLQPLTKTATGYAENINQKRVRKIKTTLKCKRKKKHYEVTLDRDATSKSFGSEPHPPSHNPDGTVTITQQKLLLKLFLLYPPSKDATHNKQSHYPYRPLPKVSDPAPKPVDHFAYLRLLGILLYLTKSRPDIMAAVSITGTKSSNPRIGISATSTMLSNIPEQRRIWDISSIIYMYHHVSPPSVLTAKSMRHNTCFTPTARVTPNIPSFSTGLAECFSTVVSSSRFLNNPNS